MVTAVLSMLREAMSYVINLRVYFKKVPQTELLFKPCGFNSNRGQHTLNFAV